MEDWKPALDLDLSWISRLSRLNLSVDHFLPSNWPVDHFSSSICLFFFPLAPLIHSCSEFCSGQSVPVVVRPLGLATGISGFTFLVKEVRKLALRLAISVHMWLQICSLEPIVVRGSFGNSLRVDS